MSLVPMRYDVVHNWFALPLPHVQVWIRLLFLREPFVRSKHLSGRTLASYYWTWSECTHCFLKLWHSRRLCTPIPVPKGFQNCMSRSSAWRRSKGLEEIMDRKGYK